MKFDGVSEHNKNQETFGDPSLEKLSPIFNKRKIDDIIDTTIEHISSWRQLAEEWDVPKILMDEIQENLRLNI